MKRQLFDQAFKQMAVELSNVKGSVKIAAAELEIDPGRISKWRQTFQGDKAVRSAKPGLTAEQVEIRRLQKKVEAGSVRAISVADAHNVGSSKKAVGIFSKGDGKSSGL